MSAPIFFDLLTSELTAESGGGSLVRRTVLPSGVRVLSESIPTAGSASVGFWVSVGSRDEDDQTLNRPSRFGSTHFLEHLLFKGTSNRTALEIAVAFDEVGGETNALTAKEHTCYHAKVQTADLEMAVGVLADMMCASLLDPEEFERERQVILEELAMADDDPADVAHERFVSALLPDHPLGRPIGGTPETIAAVSRVAVWEHYRAWYRPEQLVVTVAGAVDHDRLVEWVSRSLRLGGWDVAQSAAPAARRALGRAPSRQTGPVTVRRDLEQVSLLLGCRGLSLGDERRFAFGIFNTVLGSGMSSRLFQEVRERRGLAYSVGSFASSYSDAGMFAMFAGSSPRAVDTVLELMTEQVHNIATHGVTEAEYVRALGQLRGASALSLEDSDTRMARLGRSELGTGEFFDLEALLAGYRSVTAEQVMKVAQDLAALPFTLAAVGPVESVTIPGQPVGGR